MRSKEERQQAEARRQQQAAVSRARLLVEREASRLQVSAEAIERAIRFGFTWSEIEACNGNLAFVTMIAGGSTRVRKNAVIKSAVEREFKFLSQSSQSRHEFEGDAA